MTSVTQPLFHLSLSHTLFSLFCSTYPEHGPQLLICKRSRENEGINSKVEEDDVQEQSQRQKAGWAFELELVLNPVAFSAFFLREHQRVVCTPSNGGTSRWSQLQVKISFNQTVVHTHCTWTSDWLELPINSVRRARIARLPDRRSNAVF